MLHFLSCNRTVYPLVMCSTHNRVIWKKVTKMNSKITDLHQNPFASIIGNIICRTAKTEHL